MAYCGYITRLKNVRPHSNADRLLCGECFGNNVIVGLNYKENQLGVYFPVDGRLSEDFCNKHNLVRKKDENGNNVGGYLDPEKRNIKALKLRGEQSDGLFMPLECLSDYTDITSLKEGDTITKLNKVLICEKYIPRTKPKASNSKENISNKRKYKKKKKKIFYPYFKEHIDTAQLAYAINSFKSGDLVDITLKMHGTSQRTAYTLVQREKTYPLIVEIIRDFLRIKPKVIESYDYISGTRKAILDNYSKAEIFRKQHHDKFVNKLHRGEEVFYEVVGFTDNGRPIMPSANNKKLNDKEFVKEYGAETVFSYGCDPNGSSGIGITEQKEPQSDIYVYRMTMTTPEGEVIEYSYDYMKYRCEQMGVKVVPLLWRGIIPPQKLTFNGVTEQGNKFSFNTNKMYETADEYVKCIAEQCCDGLDPVGKTHWREGVVIRNESKPNYSVYKYKNFTFKMLEGLIKESAAEADMEERQELTENEL